MRFLLLGLVLLGFVFAVGTALTPRTTIEANRAAAEKERKEEAARQAARYAQHERVMDCVPRGAENFDPKIFSAMVEHCEREVLARESHEEAIEAGLKEKWNAPPLYEEEPADQATRPSGDEADTAEMGVGVRSP